MREVRNAPILVVQAPVLRVMHRAEVALVLTFIWIPIALTSIMAFNDGGFLSFPIRSFSLRWFNEFFSSPLWVDALLNSLLAACAVSFISTCAGAALAFVFDKYGLPRRGPLLRLLARA
jgi:ABC-type spermidine/putrescine transport system permease subunit II